MEGAENRFGRMALGWRQNAVIGKNRDNRENKVCFVIKRCVCGLSCSEKKEKSGKERGNLEAEYLKKAII